MLQIKEMAKKELIDLMEEAGGDTSNLHLDEGKLFEILDSFSYFKVECVLDNRFIVIMSIILHYIFQSQEQRTFMKVVF